MPTKSISDNLSNNKSKIRDVEQHFCRGNGLTSI